MSKKPARGTVAEKTFALPSIEHVAKRMWAMDFDRPIEQFANLTPTEQQWHVKYAAFAVAAMRDQCESESVGGPGAMPSASQTVPTEYITYAASDIVSAMKTGDTVRQHKYRADFLAVGDALFSRDVKQGDLILPGDILVICTIETVSETDPCPKCKAPVRERMLFSSTYIGCLC